MFESKQQAVGHMKELEKFEDSQNQTLDPQLIL